MTDSETSYSALQILSRCASVNLYSCSYEGRDEDGILEIFINLRVLYKVGQIARVLAPL